MLIHVVQPGDTIASIADYYGIPVTRLIDENGLINPNNLVTGQTIIITYPEITYTVKEGDTLVSIAALYNVTVGQIYANNPFLVDRDTLLPGEILIIKYPKDKGTITIHGTCVPFINRINLIKALPFMTYLSVLNFTISDEGEIITHYDDSGIIEVAKEFGVLPIMLLTTLTLKGEANIGIDYELLLNEEYQNTLYTNIIDILRTKGYYGVNLSLQYINTSNINLYNIFLTRMSEKLTAEGYLVFSTANPSIILANNEVRFEKVDYTILGEFSYNMIFMNYEWATNVNPPSPVSSITDLSIFVDYVIRYVPPEKTNIGIPTIGYDWELPYYSGTSSVYSMSYDSVINLAVNVSAIIQYDETSQTPFYEYTVNRFGNEIRHIVWFIDARSINALLGLVSAYDLRGTGIWSITYYNTQLWLLINSQYEVEKIL